MAKFVNQLNILLILLFLSLNFFVAIKVNSAAMDTDVEEYWACVVKKYYDKGSQKVLLPGGDTFLEPDCKDKLPGGTFSTVARQKAFNDCVTYSYYNRVIAKWIAEGLAVPGCSVIGFINGYTPPGESISPVTPKVPSTATEEQRIQIQCVINNFYKDNGDGTGTVHTTGGLFGIGSLYLFHPCFDTGPTNGSATIVAYQNCFNALLWDGTKWVMASDPSIPWMNGGSAIQGCIDIGMLKSDGTSDEVSLPDLEANIKKFNISNQVSCWMSNEAKEVGPTPANIWNPGNFLPLMYQCETLDANKRPLPLHPVNIWPITVRVFGFFLSLLIWIAIIMIPIYIILFIFSFAKNTLVALRKAFIGLIVSIIFILFLYIILSTILGILGLNI